MSRQPDPIRTLTGRIRTLEEQVRRQRNASAFAGTGMHPTADDGVASDNFDGDLDAGDPGTRGWAMDSDQAAFGELLLRDGIVGNAALATPLAPFALHDDAQSFAVTTSWTYPLSVGITVPAGFTRALVLNLTTGVTAYNGTGGVDFLYCAGQCSAGALSGWTLGSPDVDASGTGVANDFRVGLFTGLTPGSTLTFTGQVSTAFGTWAAIGSNVANIDVTGLWLR